MDVYNVIYNKYVKLNRKQYDKYLEVNKLKHMYYPIYDQDGDYKLEKFYLVKKFDDQGIIITERLGKYFIPRFKPVPLGVVSKAPKKFYIKYSIPVYNIYLKTYVWMNDKSFLKYIQDNPEAEKFYINQLSVDNLLEYEWNCYIGGVKELYPGYTKDLLYPYQSVDMRDMTVRLASKEDILEWIGSKNRISGYLNKYADYPSPIDIFKMKRTDITTNYKYIHELKQEVSKHQDILNEKLEEYVNNPGVNNIFIPVNYQPGDILIKNRQNIHTNDDKIKLLIDSLNLDIITKNKCLYWLYSIFTDYADFKLSDIDKYLGYYKKTVYGVDKKEVDDKIIQFKNSLYNLEKNINYVEHNFNTLEDFFNVKTTSDLLKISERDFMDNYYRIIADKKHKDESLEKIKQYYLYKTNNLHILTDYLNTYDDYNLALRNIDIFEHMTFDCNKLKIDDVNYINKIKDLYTQPNFTGTGNINFNKINNPDLYDAVMKDDKKLAFDNRQFILGDYRVTSALKPCSSLVLSDPWLNLIDLTDLTDLSWSVDLNKKFIPQQLKKDMLFPISIYLDNRPIVMYSCIDINDNNFVYLGALLLKINGSRTFNKTRYTVLYLFYNKKYSKIHLYNFRGNRVITKDIHDYIRVLYLELNVLKYIKDFNLGIDLHYYKIENTNTILVSKYTLDSIKRLGKLKIDEINQLKEVSLIKDKNREYVFIDLNQSGGYFPVDIYDEYKKILESTKNSMKDYFFLYYYVLSLDYFLLNTNVDKKVEHLLNEVYKNTQFKLTTHRFSNYIGLYMNVYLRKHNIILKDKKTLIISKKCFFLEALMYHYKYIIYDKNYKNNLKMLQYKYHEEDILDFYKDYPDNYIIDTPLNNSNINLILKDVQYKSDISIVDMNIKMHKIDERIQTIFSSVIIALKKLNIGGVLVIYVPVITKKEIFDYFIYLSRYFKKFLIEYDDQDVQSYFYNHYTYLFYIDYQGGLDFDLLFITVPFKKTLFRFIYTCCLLCFKIIVI